MILTLAAIDLPADSDLDDQVGHVAIREPYTLRTALLAEKHTLAVGVIHSHPRDCAPVPSPIDDNMDSYYSSYFEGFAPGRPYVSLIAAIVKDELALSGRVYQSGSRLTADRLVAPSGLAILSQVDAALNG